MHVVYVCTYSHRLYIRYLGYETEYFAFDTLIRMYYSNAHVMGRM